MESPRAATAPLFSDAAAAVGTPAATGPPTPLAPPSSIVLHGQAAAAAAATAQQLLLAKVGATTAMQSVAAMAAASPTGPERTFSVRLGGTGADSPSSDGKLAVFGTGSFRGTGSLKLIPEAAIAKSLLARKATISSAEFGRAHQGTPSPPNLLPPASNNTDRNQPLPDKGKLPYYMWNAISSAIGLSQQAAPRSPSGKSAGDDNVPRLSISTASVASAPAAESIQTAFTMGSVPFHSPPSTPCEQELSAGKADYHLDSITKNPAQNQIGSGNERDISPHPQAPMEVIALTESNKPLALHEHPTAMTESPLLQNENAEYGQRGLPPIESSKSTKGNANAICHTPRRQPTSCLPFRVSPDQYEQEEFASDSRIHQIPFEGSCDSPVSSKASSDLGLMEEGGIYDEADPGGPPLAVCDLPKQTAEYAIKKLPLVSPAAEAFSKDKYDQPPRQKKLIVPGESSTMLQSLSGAMTSTGAVSTVEYPQRSESSNEDNQDSIDDPGCIYRRKPLWASPKSASAAEDSSKPLTRILSRVANVLGWISPFYRQVRDPPKEIDAELQNANAGLREGPLAANDEITVTTKWDPSATGSEPRITPNHQRKPPPALSINTSVAAIESSATRETLNTEEANRAPASASNTDAGRRSPGMFGRVLSRSSSPKPPSQGRGSPLFKGIRLFPSRQPSPTRAKAATIDLDNFPRVADRAPELPLPDALADDAAHKTQHFEPSPRIFSASDRTSLLSATSDSVLNSPLVSRGTHRRALSLSDFPLLGSARDRTRPHPALLANAGAGARPPAGAEFMSETLGNLYYDLCHSTLSITEISAKHQVEEEEMARTLASLASWNALPTSPVIADGAGPQQPQPQAQVPPPPMLLPMSRSTTASSMQESIAGGRHGGRLLWPADGDVVSLDESMLSSPSSGYFPRPLPLIGVQAGPGGVDQQLRAATAAGALPWARPTVLSRDPVASARYGSDWIGRWGRGVSSAGVVLIPPAQLGAAHRPLGTELGLADAQGRSFSQRSEASIEADAKLAMALVDRIF